MDFKLSSTLQIVEDLHFLQPTDFCDANHPQISRAVQNIIRGTTHKNEQARRVFYWVRDSIKYELGLSQDRASETLRKGVGSCSNKANLFVAMMRNLNVPAGFHTLFVRGKDYLGVFATPRFHLFMADKSLHAFCSVFLQDRWLRVDPSDDIRLSNGIQHLCSQATTVDFDGQNEALMQLSPEHVIQTIEERLPSLDHVFQKRKRVPQIAIDVFNLYMDYLRSNCIWYSNPQEIEDDFFVWLKEQKPAHFEEYNQLSAAWLAQQNAAAAQAQAGAASAFEGRVSP